MTKNHEEHGFCDLLYEKSNFERGAVTTLTLNRPSVTNALSIRLSDELARAIELVRADDETKVLVITGAGENFCAGDDLTEMSAGAWGDANDTMRRVRRYQDMANALEELDKVTISAVRGYCVGGGLEITMACDFVICEASARWGMPEVDWGITPGWGGTTRMARLIGRRMTKEVNMLGALHSAKRGVELGLFNRVVADGELDTETARLAQLILLKNHQGLRQFKVMINRGVEADLSTAQGFELMSAGLTAAVLGRWQIPDADGDHGWSAYRAGDRDNLISRRRRASKDFWTD
ncbi:MAG: enoyl-CoA hydratase/isomerase family protein [Myxococcota bacterium]